MMRNLKEIVSDINITSTEFESLCKRFRDDILVSGPKTLSDIEIKEVENKLLMLVWYMKNIKNQYVINSFRWREEERQNIRRIGGVITSRILLTSAIFEIDILSKYDNANIFLKLFGGSINLIKLIESLNKADCRTIAKDIHEWLKLQIIVNDNNSLPYAVLNKSLMDLMLFIELLLAIDFNWNTLDEMMGSSNTEDFTNMEQFFDRLL
jgi:hypothetical protein